MDNVVTWLLLLIFTVNAYGLGYDVMFVSEDAISSFLEYRGFPGKFKYLTFWNQILQTVYFGFSVINDVFGSNLKADKCKDRGQLQKFRDVFVASIVFPVGSFVVLTFWSLYAIDRELVFPKALDAVVPQWLNHVMHTTVIIFLMLEKFAVYHHYPNRRTGLLCTLLFALTYQLWILWIAYHANIWVYPILAVLSWTGRIGFFAACWVMFILLYLLGEKITDILWQPAKLKKRAKKMQ